MISICSIVEMEAAYLFRNGEISIRLGKVCIVAIGTFPLCHEAVDFALVALEIRLERMAIRHGSGRWWGPSLTFLSLRFLIVFFIGSR